MKIHIQNLRSIGDKTIELNYSTALVGENGAGKSTIVSTPYWVLTGKGLSLQNNKGFAVASIEFNNIKIERTMQGKKSTLRYNNRPCTLPTLIKELAAKGIQYELLVSLFDPITTITSSALLKAIKAVYSPEQIIDLIGCPNDEYISVLSDYFFDKAIDEITVACIKQVEKDFTEKRKIAKKEAASLTPLLGEEDLANYNVFITSNNALLSKLIAENKENQAKLKTLFANAAKREIIEENILKKEKKIQELKKEIEPKNKASEQELKKLEEDLLHSSQKLRSLQSELNQLKREEIELDKQISLKNNEIDTKNDIIAELVSNLTCPLYDKIRCPVNKDSIIDSIHEQVQALEKESLQKADELNAVEKKKAFLSEELNTEQNNNDILLKKVTDIQQIIDTQNSADVKKQQLIQLQKEVGELEKTKEEFNTDGIESLQAIISENEKTIEDVKGQNVDLRMLQEQQAKQKKVREMLNTKTFEIEMYTYFIKRFASLPAETIEKKLDILNRNISNVINRLKSNFSITFKIDKNDLAVIVTTPNGEIAFEELSEGEKVCVNYALKNLVCDLAGISYIFIDNCNHLDEKAFDALAEMTENSDKTTILVTSAKVPPHIKTTIL